MKNSIDYNLYTLTQDELRDHIQKNHNCYELDGNLYSIKHINAPCFIAHLDTVRDSDMKKKLYIDNQNHLRRKDGILGADDRAGINLILNHSKQVNWIFTRDEEIGLVGARIMGESEGLKDLLNKYETTCFIELDRMDYGHIIGINNSYCNTDLDKAITDILPLYQTDTGICTDLDELVPMLGISGVNLSVGYFNQHSKNESLDIEYFNWLNSQILKLNKGLSNRDKFDDPEAMYSDDWWDEYDSYEEDTSLYTGPLSEEEEEDTFFRDDDYKHIDDKQAEEYRLEWYLGRND